MAHWIHNCIKKFDFITMKTDKKKKLWIENKDKQCGTP